MKFYWKQIENNSSKTIRIIRIILLILIIIGIGLLLTQKIWVPKLVDKILSYEHRNIPIVVLPEIQPNISLTDGRQCYTYNHEATKDEPYKVNEFIDITISGTKVTGTKRGTQSGPDMTNGYNGTLVGTLDKDTITSIFSYVIEGSSGKEKEIYKTSKTGIDKLRYQLIEKDKMLVPDTTKDFKILSYARVGCTASN